MKHMETAFNTTVATVATFITYLLGGWDTAVIVLVVFMVLDYITGVVNACISKTLSSEVGIKGLSKKFLILS